MNSHNAPPVIYPLGRSHLQGWLLSVLWFSGLLLMLVWFGVSQQLNWRFLCALVAVVIAGLAAFSGWRNSPIGQLVWDAQSWRWESSSYQTGVAELKLVVVVDFQHLLVIRMENQANARWWLWVERKSKPERWLDFRRAVYSPRKAISPSIRQELKHSEVVSTLSDARLGNP